jgi:hypothetical protein
MALAALILTAPALLGNQGGQVRTTPAQELKKLHRPDAEPYASTLYDDSARWSYISTKIATGEQDWLEVARLLVPRADGALAEELRSDLALALLVHPANVLRLGQVSGTGSAGFHRSIRLGPADFCNAPFPSPGKTWLTRYKRRALRSVRRVHEARLTKVRDECLRVLRSVDLSRPPDAYD